MIEQPAGSAGDVFFAPFRLDPASGRLWSGATEVAIRPKTFAVLRSLVESPGRLVTVGDLVHAVWAGSHGSAPLVKGCIRELRMLLGDDHESPRYIETVGRRGYRFAAPVDARGTAHAPPPAGAVPFVGRRAELERLDRLLAAALGGKRQIVLVSGEPGIGKTTLTERFLNAALSRTELRLGRGHCVERSGTGEPYQPVLEALERMCRGQGGKRALGVLERYAPTWLGELSPLRSGDEREKAGGQAQGATRERMLREMCDAFEALAADRPLILWLDDLQWSDPSTIDLVVHLASRAEPARLLLLGTYRPAEAVVSRHPLRAARQGLVARGLCQDVALGFLSHRDVEDYLALCFAANDHPPGFAATLLEITGGNPLFLSALLEDLVKRRILVEERGRWRLRGKIETLGKTVPDTLRRLIDRQVEQLTPEDRKILEAGSVAGREFAAGAVADALGIDPDEADTRLEALAAHAQLVEPRGLDSSPARAASGRYAFVHSLHQRALYARLPPFRRARLHRRLGAAQERAWGDRADEIAAELALHFEEGCDMPVAIRHLRIAGENAARRFAESEAIAHLTRALGLIERLPRGDRPPEELAIRMALGPLLMTSRGYAAPEVDRTYRRAADLCVRIGNRPGLFPTLRALHRFTLLRGNMKRALLLARKCVAMARKGGNPEELLEAYLALGETLFYAGQLAPGRAALARALRLQRSVQGSTPAFRVQDPAVGIHGQLGGLAWLFGEEPRMREHHAEMFRTASAVAHPFSLAYAHATAALHHHLAGDVDGVRADSETLLALSTEHGFPLWVAWARSFGGWAIAVGSGQERGVDEIRAAIEQWQATGANFTVQYHLGLLAEAEAALGRHEAALATVEEALGVAKRSGERWWEAALLRLEGELLAELSHQLRGSRRTRARREAVAKLRKAVAVACRQGATALAARARAGLRRLV